MGRKWKRFSGKGQTLRTVDGESVRERRAFWNGVQAAAAAAATALESLHGFPPYRVREFVDDMDLGLDPNDNDAGAAARILAGYGIRMSRDPDAPGETRFDIRPDGNVCNSCGFCEHEDGLYHCRLRASTAFRRGRSKCKLWRSAKDGQVHDWQEKIMKAGGPPARNDITDNQQEWLEMMDEIRTGKNT